MLVVSICVKAQTEPPAERCAPLSIAPSMRRCEQHFDGFTVTKWFDRDRFHEMSIETADFAAQRGNILAYLAAAMPTLAPDSPRPLPRTELEKLLDAAIEYSPQPWLHVGCIDWYAWSHDHRGLKLQIDRPQKCP